MADYYFPPPAYDDPSGTYQSVPSLPVPATVEVLPVVTDPVYSSASNDAALYTYWKLENIYDTRSMRAQMPIAAAPSTGANYNATSVIVKLAGDQSRRKIRVTAQRLEAEPEFPDPENLPYFPLPSGLPSSAGILQSCLRRKVRPATVEVTVLGQSLYTADAEYLIALSRAPNAGERLAVGNDKWNNYGDQWTQANGNLTNSDWNSNSYTIPPE